MAAIACVILGNAFIVISLKSRNFLGLKHIVTMGAGIVIVAVFAVTILMEDVPIPTVIQMAWEDLRAIEQDDLGTYTRIINLEHRPVERLWELPSMSGGGRIFPIYRIRPTGESYFVLLYPRSVAPGLIRERLAAPEYRIFESQESVRMYAVRYTPNFHIVVEFIPRRGG